MGRKKGFHQSKEERKAKAKERRRNYIIEYNARPGVKSYRSAKAKVRNARPEIKALRKVISARPENVAQRKKYASSPRGIATAKAFNRTPRRKA